MSLIWGSHTLVMTRVDKLADRSVDNMMVEITDKSRLIGTFYFTEIKSICPMGATNILDNLYVDNDKTNQNILETKRKHYSVFNLGTGCTKSLLRFLGTRSLLTY